MSANADKERFLYFTSIIDYLKVNEYRIASHSLVKKASEGPLASRADLVPIVTLIKDDKALNILALDPRKKITLVTALIHPELVAHFRNDESFVQALKLINGLEAKDIHYILVTDGVVMPDITMESPYGSGELKQELITALGIDETQLKEKVSSIDFIEARFKPEKLHGQTDQKIYLRQLVSKMRKINPTYLDSDKPCSCGDRNFEGTYTINFYQKALTCKFWVCPACGIQTEDEKNVELINNFVQGLD